MPAAGIALKACYPRRQGPDVNPPRGKFLYKYAAVYAASPAVHKPQLWPPRTAECTKPFQFVFHPRSLFFIVLYIAVCWVFSGLQAVETCITIRFSQSIRSISFAFYFPSQALISFHSLRILWSLIPIMILMRITLVEWPNGGNIVVPDGHECSSFNTDILTNKLYWKLCGKSNRIFSISGNISFFRQIVQ